MYFSNEKPMIQNMKKWMLAAVLFPLTAGAQNAEATMSPSLWLGIWDNVKHASELNVLPIGYNDIPEEAHFRGVIVECLEFRDKNGDNLLILTQTGIFPVSAKNNEGVYEKRFDRAEVRACLYVKKTGASGYDLLWKKEMVQDCEGGDLYAGFTKKSLAVSDLDKDGIAEVSFQMLTSCRSDVSPAKRCLLLFEGTECIEWGGETQLEDMSLEAPKKKIPEAVSPEVQHFLEEQWKRFAEEEFLQFYYAE